MKLACSPNLPKYKKRSQESHDPKTYDPATHDPETRDPETHDPATRDPGTCDPKEARVREARGQEAGVREARVREARSQEAGVQLIQEAAIRAALRTWYRTFQNITYKTFIFGKSQFRTKPNQKIQKMECMLLPPQHKSCSSTGSKLHRLFICPAWPQYIFCICLVPVFAK